MTDPALENVQFNFVNGRKFTIAKDSMNKITIHHDSIQFMNNGITETPITPQFAKAGYLNTLAIYLFIVKKIIETVFPGFLQFTYLFNVIYILIFLEYTSTILPSLSK